MKRRKTVSARRHLRSSAGGILRFRLIIIVGILVLGAAGAIFLLHNNTGLSAAPDTNTALNPDCIYNDPDLCKFVNKWNLQKEYTMNTIMTVGNDTTETQYQITENASRIIVKRNGKEESHMITIGTETYTKDYTDNTWLRQSLHEDRSEDLHDKTSGPLPTEEPYQLLDEGIIYTFISKEPCGQLDCFIYEVENDVSNATKQRIWFDDSAYLLRRLRLEDSNGIVTESFYTYDPITISTPSPVKDIDPETTE